MQYPPRADFLDLKKYILSAVEGSLQHQPFAILGRHRTTSICHPDIIPSGIEALLVFADQRDPRSIYPQLY